MSQSVKLTSVTGLVLLLCDPAPAGQPPADIGVLDLTLPPGATITINGTDYGTERHFEMRPLDGNGSTLTRWSLGFGAARPHNAGYCSRGPGTSG